MDINEYQEALNVHIASNQFAMLNPQQQQESIAGVRNWYLQENPDAAPAQVDRVTEGTNVTYLRNTGQGRALPIIDIGLPSQDPRFKDLNKEQQLQKIDEYKLKIPEIAATAPTQQEDAKYFIDQSVRALERQVNGQDTGYLADKGKRLVEGFAAGLASGIGADSAAEGIQDFFHENTKYDEDFTSQLAQGLGSAGSSVLIIAGAAAASGGLGATAATAEAIGVGASLASNGIMRYNEGYKNAIAKGLNPDQAHEMGVSAMPAAVIDALSDKIIASKLMPHQINKVFASGSDAAKKAMFTEITKEVSLRGKLVNWAESAITEGLSESVGDYAAAYGPYLKSGDESYLPSDKESLNSFVIGAIIGGGIPAISDLPNLVGDKTGAPKTVTNPDGTTSEVPTNYSSKSERDVAETQRNVDKLDPNHSSEVFNLLAEGRYSEARQLSDTYLKESLAPPTPPAATPTINPTKPAQTPQPPDTTAEDAEAERLKNDIAQREAEAKAAGLESSPELQAAKDQLAAIDQARQARAAAPIINVTETGATQQENPNPISSFALPSELQKASPRYGKSELQFENDFDKAAYILANDSKGTSKAAPKFRAALANLGISPEQIVAHGNKVRESIKNLAPTITGEKIVTTVPAISFESNIKPKSKTAQKAEAAKANASSAVATAFGHTEQSAEPIINVNEVATPTPTPNETQTNQGQVSETDGLPAVQGQPAVGEATSQTEAGTPQGQGKGSQEVNASEAVTEVAGEAVNTLGVPAPVTTMVKPGNSTPDAFFKAVRSIVSPDKVQAFNEMLLDIKMKNPQLRFTMERAPHYPIGAAGLYDGKRNVIYIKKLDYRTIAHETAHALTQSNIRQWVTGRPEATHLGQLQGALKDANTPQSIKTLIDVYLHSAKILGQEQFIGIEQKPENMAIFQLMPQETYAMTTIDEFVAGVMTLQSLQERLANIPYNGKSLWENIVEAISNGLSWMRGVAQPDLLLRSDGDNALVAALASTREIIDTKAGKEKSNINYIPINQPQTTDPDVVFDGGILYLPAYHGTPHNVDQFSTNRIGTGEGVQAYGYGLYFAGREDVAKWYRDTLSAKQSQATLIVGGETWAEDDVINGFSNREDQMLRKLYKNIKFNASKGVPDIDLAFDQLVKQYDNEDTIAFIREIQSRGITFQGNLESIKGNLYTVDIRPNQEELLDWDLPLGQQSKEVQDKVSKIFFDYLASDDYKSTPWGANDTISTEERTKEIMRMTGEQHYNSLVNRGMSEKEASDLLYNAGIPGIKYFDGMSRNRTDASEKEFNYVVFNDKDIKITHRNGEEVTPEEAAANQSPNQSEPRSQESNINYLPEQTRAQQLTNSFKRMRDISQGKITDKIDTPTQRIMTLLKDIKYSDVFRLPNNLQDYFFELVDNIYESRKAAVQNPQIRVDSDEMIQRILAVKLAIDSDRIHDMISKYDDVIDFDGLGIDTDNRQAVEQAINDYMEKEQVTDPSKRQNRSAEAKARVQQLYQKYRDSYNEIKTQVKARFADKDNYIKEVEAIYGQSLDAFPALKEFLGFHHDYLMTADTSTLESKALYQHFFAIQNLLDGNFRGMDLTAQHIGKVRDIQDDIKSLTGQFRDPVTEKSKMWRALDWVNKMSEIHQTKLQRLSGYETARKFIQDKLLGKFYDGIVRVAQNQKLKFTDEYIAFRDQVLGRESTAEDKIVCAIMGRLSQYQQVEDPDAALMKNIRKERQSIANKINGAVTTDAKRQYRLTISPLFEGIVKGLEEHGEGSMIHFMDTFAERARGTQDSKTGEQRRMLVDKTQEIFSRYTLASRILSEGFQGKTFNQQVSYIPNDVRRAHDGEDPKPRDVTDTSREEEYNRNRGLTAEESFYKERQSDLGQDGFYSYNNENVLKRNVEKLSVDHATLPERFVIKSRLKKGGELNKIITQTKENEFHQQRVDYISSLVNQVISNATSAGAPQNAIIQVLNKVTKIYAQGTLSGLHHIISQNVSAITDYGFRTGNFAGWMQAAAYYASNFDRVNKWLAENQRWTGDRAAIEAQGLDNSRTPVDESAVASLPIVKFLSKFHENAGHIITTSLRLGDNFSTKVTMLAEYQRLRKEKGYKFENINDIDFTVTEGNLLTQATLNAERIVNVSNKILRADLFSDRNMNTTIVRNLLFAFSAHGANLATQANLAVRDLIELKGTNAPKAEIEAKIRTIGAIAAQGFMFASARFAVGALAGKLIIALVQDLFDDDEGKIEELETKVQIARKRSNGSEKAKIKINEAESELANAKTVRSMLTKYEANHVSTDAWFKSVIKEMSGSVHLAMNNNSINNMAMWIPDQVMGHFAKEGQKQVEADISAQIKVAKERHNDKLVAKLTEQQTVINATEYLPLAYTNQQGTGIPGIYGSSLDQYYRVAQEAAGAFQGTKEWNYSDWISAVATAGVIPTDVNKALLAIDKIEDKMAKDGKAAEERAEKIHEEAKHKKSNINYAGFR